MNVQEQIDGLKTIYEESCHSTHTNISSEPEYTCNYCDYSDIAPSHAEECVAVELLIYVSGLIVHCSPWRVCSARNMPQVSAWFKTWVQKKQKSDGNVTMASDMLPRTI